MDYPSGKSEFAVAQGVTAYPIRAATSPPFQHTNLVVFVREAERAAVIVDPGGNDAAALAVALKAVPGDLAEVFVVVTHRHADHWASLHQVLQFFPAATLCGSKECLSQVSGTERWKKSALFPMDRESRLAGLRIIPTPGHTDGDVSVMDGEQGVVCVGDHCVGFGSSLLDADCGDMSNYLDSCQKLIALEPRIVIPAHGPINHDPITLLKMYIAHRLERERQVQECVDRGLNTPQQIVEVVYASTPKNLWPAAMSNIALHLRRIKNRAASL